MICIGCKGKMEKESEDDGLVRYVCLNGRCNINAIETIEDKS